MVVPNPQREQYTVGWLCGLPEEAAAAQAMLDETYSALPAEDAPDSNVYAFGSMCNHKVVIATLSDGFSGTTSAASTAKEMLLSFPNIRFGLLVGVGGGIPSKEHDIRLGDVVVSRFRKISGGNSQHSPREEASPGFQETRSLNRSHSVLRKAITSLRSRHALYGSREVPRHIFEACQKFPHFQARHPGLDQDRLFKASYDHPNAHSRTCQDCDSTQLVNRDLRDSQDPSIHYLGGETETTRFTNGFPWLVIRGICDYCDSHKNTRWQAYAALTAAAYARELLSTISVLEVLEVEGASILPSTTSVLGVPEAKEASVLLSTMPLTQPEVDSGTFDVIQESIDDAPEDVDRVDQLSDVTLHFKQMLPRKKSTQT